MSRTDKDKPYKYRSDDEWPRGVWRLGRKKNANKVNLTKGYEDGPGGKDCSCCGVQHDYKGMMRRDAKRAIALALQEMEDNAPDVCECDFCLTL